MKSPSLFLLSLSCVFLGACSLQKSDQPVLGFIGIGTGTLATNLQQIQFRDRFTTEERELVAVAAFEKIRGGSTVMATWFSPDERRMPLGRTTIAIESGATVARFSFASKVPWEAAPYQLRIDAMTGEGERVKTASGSISFYIGLSDSDVAAYQQEFAAWQQADAAARASWDVRTREQENRLQQAKKLVRAKFGSLLLEHDLTGDGQKEYVYGMTKEEQMMPPGGSPGVLASADVDQLVVLDSSGVSLLMLRAKGGKRVLTAGEEMLSKEITGAGTVHVTFLPTGTCSLTWQEKSASCTLEVRRGKEGFSAGEPVCIEQ